MRTASELMALTHMGKALEYYDADRLELAHAAMALALNAGVQPTSIFDRQRALDAELGARREGERWRIGEHLIVEAPNYLLRNTSFVEITSAATMDVTETWSVRWGKPVLVTVFATQDAALFLHSRYGYYSPRSEAHKICLPPSVCAHPDLLRQAVRHEAAHAAVHTLAGDAVPRWLDEGIAVWTEGGGGPHNDRRVRLAAMKRRLPLPTPDDVAASLGTYEVELDSARAADAYAAAGSFAGHLIDRFGVADVRRFLVAVGESGEAKRTVRRTFGRDLRELVRSWWQAIEGAA